MTTVVVYAPDLMDRSRFDPLKEEVDLKFASQVSSLATVDADIVAADLSRNGVLDALAQSSVSRKLGFVSHVDADKRSEAQSAGIEVYARSRFFSKLVPIITHSGTPGADNGDHSAPS